MERLTTPKGSKVAAQAEAIAEECVCWKFFMCDFGGVERGGNEELTNERAFLILLMVEGAWGKAVAAAAGGGRGC